jgi:peptidoglycan/xylan/chitin deacetylase (PgdA/CDA1 family)
LKRAFFELFAGMRLDRLAWALDPHPLRILMYHGVCEDELAGQSWVPRSFVSRSVFEQQLDYLRRYAFVLPISEAIGRLQNGTLPQRSVAITFDDGYANNLHVAAPMLQKYGLPATIFLATAYVESGDFLPFDRVRLIRLAHVGGYDSVAAGNNNLLEYKTNPVDAVLERASRWWNQVRAQLTEKQRDTLRPLRVEELRNFDPKLFDFGAHSHSHCILRNETLVRREWELRHSVETLRQWIPQRSCLFAYPNGSRGDFSELDKAILRSLGIEAALSTIPGLNRTGCDLLELRRLSVGLYHDDSTFAVEATGVRAFLRSWVPARSA